MLEPEAKQDFNEYGIELSDVEQEIHRQGRSMGWLKRKALGFVCLLVSLGVIVIVCYTLERFKEQAKEFSVNDAVTVKSYKFSKNKK